MNETQATALAKKAKAWARRWHLNGETPKKEKNEAGRWAWPVKFKFLPVTEHQCCKDDEPLYTRQQVIEELAQQTAVMPQVREVDDYGGALKMCSSTEVRDALAIVQAQKEQEQADAARYRWIEEMFDYKMKSSRCRHMLDALGLNDASELEGLSATIDSAMKGEEV